MSERTPDKLNTPPVSSQTDEVDTSRRKLAGAALGVSAIFTLASRPVLAGQCMTPSSAASGNLSTHGTPPNCTGRTPAQWVASTNGNSNSNNENNGFPGGNVNFHFQSSTVLNGVFKKGSRANWNGNTLRAVMGASDNGNASPSANPISKEFAAALLNIRGGFVPVRVLTEVQLIGMWNEWMDSGVFAPKANASWTANQIVTYLRTLQA